MVCDRGEGRAGGAGASSSQRHANWSLELEEGHVKRMGSGQAEERQRL